jgi:hypothetical protein
MFLPDLGVAGLADDLHLVRAHAGRLQRGGQARFEGAGLPQDEVAHVRVAAQIGHDAVRRVLAQRRERDVDRRELAVRAQLRVLRLERVADRGEDLERRDVRVEDIGLALAAGDRLGGQNLADDRALASGSDAATSSASEELMSATTTWRLRPRTAVRSRHPGRPRHR